MKDSRHSMRAAAATAAALAALGAAAFGGAGPEPVGGLDGIERICRDVEAIRGLGFRAPVATRTQTIEEFKGQVRKAVAKQFGEAGAQPYAEALYRLGAIERSVDLTETLLGLLENQAAAHYDPEAKVYCLLRADLPPSVLDLISSHELCHALQDQHYDLRGLLEGDLAALRDNGDAATAKQCLVEGDATLVMTIWTLRQNMGMAEPGLSDTLASAAVVAQAALDLDTILAMVESGVLQTDPAMGGLGLDMKDLGRYPRFLVETLLAAYTQGALMVDRVKTRGGWDAVNALYRDPPLSTEQVLHPDKLQAPRDDPVDVRMPALAARLPKGWRLAEEDVLGELGLRVWLGRFRDPRLGGVADPASAAAGWDGDRYYYFTDGQAAGRYLLVWQTVWDSPSEAAEFVTAYRSALAVRFPAMRKFRRSEPGAAFAYQIWEVEPGRFLKLARSESVVGVVDTTEPSLTGAAWE